MIFSVRGDVFLRLLLFFTMSDMYTYQFKLVFNGHYFYTSLVKVGTRRNDALLQHFILLFAILLCNVYPAAVSPQSSTCQSGYLRMLLLRYICDDAKYDFSALGLYTVCND